MSSENSENNQDMSDKALDYVSLHESVKLRNYEFFT